MMLRRSFPILAVAFVAMASSYAFAIERAASPALFLGVRTTVVRFSAFFCFLFRSRIGGSLASSGAAATLLRRSNRSCAARPDTLCPHFGCGGPQAARRGRVGRTGPGPGAQPTTL